MPNRKVRLSKQGHLILPPIRSRLPVEKRVSVYHGEISEADFKKIAKESKSCPVCMGRPLLHMRLCMRKPKELEKLKRSM